MIASRGYVQYIINSEVAQDFLAWVEDTAIPDETFFTSLNYNPQLGVPGSFTGWHDNDDNDSFNKNTRHSTHTIVL